jgi:hypothetical protein
MIFTDKALIIVYTFLPLVKYDKKFFTWDSPRSEKDPI